MFLLPNIGDGFVNIQPDDDVKTNKSESYSDYLMKQKIEKKKRDSILTSVIGIFSLLALLLIFTMIRSCDIPDSNYKTKNIKDMTNKEYNDFMKWQERGRQKKIDESPAFK